MKLASVAASAASLFVEGFAHDIVRLRVRPERQFVFEVPEVIIAKPVDPSQLQVAGSESNQHCVQLGESWLTVEEKEHELAFSFANAGTTTITGSISLKDLSVPDVTLRFPAAKHTYGVPEHTMDLAMHSNEKYELFNTDAFKFPMHSGEPTYGCVPFLLGYSAAVSTGLLFLNASDAHIEVLEAEVPSVRWTTEVGITDLFFIPGPTPASVQRHHASLTGSTFLPPYSTLGYHQCRYSYMSTDDCISVDTGMSGNDMPYDVLWLDVDYADGKKYFLWDHEHFPKPQELVDYLASRGRKLVTIKDPHTKKETGYFVYDEGVEGDHFVKTADGKTDYEAECWPGISCWPDFLQSRTREWYAQYFHDDRYEAGGRTVYSWIDMNEPAVFNGYREKVMAMEAIHHTDDGHAVEHRYLHNLYGFLSVLSAQKGCLEAAGPNTAPERPFLLTRSFFAGSQRLAAMWTGDNGAFWEYLEGSCAQLLGLSISNYPFCGADCGGFIKEPSEELFTRWMQAGVFYPFFRGHANNTTRRREPFVWPIDTRDILRRALSLRYALVPYLYTVFYHAHIAGDTVLRPLFFEFPGEEDLAEVQETYMFGPALLVRPVVKEGAEQVCVHLPKSARWYAFPSGEPAAAGQLDLPVTMESVPMYLRGGCVLPTKQKARPSTVLAADDPFTLYVALDEDGTSAGDVYLDDGRTYDYQSGAFLHRRFTFTDGKLMCAPHKLEGSGGGDKTFRAVNAVERVVFFGLEHAPSSASVGDTQLAIRHEKPYVEVELPNLSVAEDWTVQLQ